MHSENEKAFLDALNANALTHSLFMGRGSSSANRSRVDETMLAIKAYIIREHLQPGDSLPTELELCENLNSARSSIREALRKLEALDIVSVVHGKGTFVGSLSLEPLVETLSFRAMLPHEETDTYDSLEDIIELRKILDQGLAPQIVACIQKLSDEEIAHLRSLTMRMKDSAQDGHTFLVEDISFHQDLIAPVNNAIAKQLAQSLWLVHMAVVPALDTEISADLDCSAQSHSVMLDSALRGDVEGYRKAVESHYEPIEHIIRTKRN